MNKNIEFCFRIAEALDKLLLLRANSCTTILTREQANKFNDAINILIAVNDEIYSQHETS